MTSGILAYLINLLRKPIYIISQLLLLYWVPQFGQILKHQILCGRIHLLT